jgi:hypothetical protein
MVTDNSIKTKTLIIVSSIVGALLLIAVIIIGVLIISNSSAPTKDDKTNSSEGQLSEDINPVIENAKIVRETENLEAKVTADIKKTSEKYTYEWRILDANKRIVDSNSLKTATIESIVPLEAGNNIFSLQVRSSNSTNYSPWSASEPLIVNVSDIEEDQGINTEAKPDPAYFDTAWAKGEPGTDATLEEAFTAAWGIKRAAYEDRCGSINSAIIKPGEMFAPVPSQVPSEYYLSYDFVQDIGTTDNSFRVLYYWCQK